MRACANRKGGRGKCVEVVAIGAIISFFAVFVSKDTSVFVIHVKNVRALLFFFSDDEFLAPTPRVAPAFI